MKARIEKKLSKRLVQLMPKKFQRAWIDHQVMASSWDQGVRVSHCYSVGGEYCSYLGDCADTFTVWEWWTMNWFWIGPFELYPAGHELEHYPNTEGFRPTTRNLLRLAGGET